jgi:hypothetical protein
LKNPLALRLELFRKTSSQENFDRDLGSAAHRRRSLSVFHLEELSLFHCGEAAGIDQFPCRFYEIQRVRNSFRFERVFLGVNPSKKDVSNLSIAVPASSGREIDDTSVADTNQRSSL